MVTGGIYLCHDVWRNILQVVVGLAKASVDGQKQVFAKHTLDDVLRRAYHVVILMPSLYLGKHHLVDVEGLVDDANLLACLLFVPFRKVGKCILVNVVCPVIYL